MKLLTPYMKGYRFVMILGPLLKLLEAILELCVPLIVAVIIDRVTTGSFAIVPQLWLLVILAVCGVASAIAAQYFSAKGAIGYTSQLTQALYRKITCLDSLTRHTIGDASLVTRLANDTYQIQTGLNLFFRLFLRSPFIVVGAVVMAWHLSPRLAGYLAVMIGLLYLVLALIILGTSYGYRRIRQATDNLVNQTQELVQGNRVIRGFNQAPRALEDYNQHNTLWTDEQLAVGRLAVLTNPITYLIVNLTLIAILWQGADMIGQSLLTKGTLVALVNYLTLILSELIKTTIVLTNLNKAWISAQRIASVLDLPEVDVMTQQYEVAATTIRVNGLGFTYPQASQSALHDITFELVPGQWLGVTGVTGGGKSTLLNLLVGVLSPTQGQLLGVQAHAIAWVPQKAQLFQGTIRSNLLLANPDADEAALWEALDIAQASEFVRAKAMGLDEVVEPFGRNFSGGQRQRLTIARALLANRPVLILDDATSALDYTTETNVLQGMIQARPEMTVVMVSQRLNALQVVDYLLVLEEGHQSGYGTPAELLVSNSYYQTLYQAQSATKEVD